MMLYVVLLSPIYICGFFFALLFFLTIGCRRYYGRASLVQLAGMSAAIAFFFLGGVVWLWHTYSGNTSILLLIALGGVIIDMALYNIGFGAWAEWKDGNEPRVMFHRTPTDETAKNPDQNEPDVATKDEPSHRPDTPK
jgi:hypothetical protein